MKLLTRALLQTLLRNGGTRKDHKPVVKFFDPAGSATWLISEMDEDGDTLFGLCDLGMGFPELGYLSLAELASVKGAWGLGIERDRHWKATKTLAEYAREARAAQRIIA